MIDQLPPPTLVQDARGLSKMLADVERQHEVAVDTEADSFYSYHEKVCLIQVTVEDRDYLVDPLAGFDVSAFGRVLANPKLLKVFHDGEYDILIMKRAFGFAFKNLFDTRVAAATLGSQNPGLATVLKDHFKIELDKSMQRSNWAQRPLTEKQIKYARLDTHFLLPLMREQRSQLDARSRGMIVHGECLRLEQILPPDTTFDPDEFVRLKGARGLGPLECQVLRELFTLREKLASESDQPPFRVINNETLIHLAAARPRYFQDLQKVNGFSAKQAHRLGDQVLAAVARAVELGPLRKFPSLPSKDGTGDLTDAEIELHERLKEWRKHVAAKMGVDAAYLLNRRVLLALARERPADERRLAKIEGMLPWQVSEFGGPLLELIARFERDLAGGAISPKRRRGPRRR